jgi:hypothetical protein
MGMVEEMKKIVYNEEIYNLYYSLIIASAVFIFRVTKEQSSYFGTFIKLDLSICGVRLTTA